MRKTSPPNRTPTQAPDLLNRLSAVPVDRRLLPAAVTLIFVAVFVLLLWLIQHRLYTEQVHYLSEETAEAQDDILFHLDAHWEYLELLGEALAQGGAGEIDYTAHAEQHSGLLYILWVGPDAVVRGAAPYTANRGLVGQQYDQLISSHPFRQVIVTPEETARPGVVAVQEGVPIYRDGEPMGVVIGVYSLESLLAYAVRPSIVQEYHISLVSTSGETLASLPSTGPIDRRLVRSVPLGATELDLYLRLARYKWGGNELVLGLSLLALVFAVGMGGALSALLQENSRQRQAEQALEAARSMLKTEVERRTDELRQVNQALGDSERRFRMLAEAALAGVYIIQDGVFRYVNPALAQVFGYKPDEIMGKLTPYDLTRRVDHDKVRENIRRRIEGDEESIQYEFQGCRRDGQVIICEVLGRIVELDGKRAIIGTLLDVTERKRMVEALARERDLLHALMDNIPDQIYFKDTGSRFMRINPAQARVLGVDEPEAAIGKTDFDFLNDELARNAYADEQQLFRTGQPLVGKLECIQQADGQRRWVSATKVPVLDSDGNVAGLVGVSRDVTAERAAAEALRQSEQRFRLLAESSPMGIWLIDTDGYTLYINPAMCAMLDIDGPADLEGEVYHGFITPESMVVMDRERIKRRQGLSSSYEVELISRRGRRSNAIVSGAPVMSADGRLISLIGTFVDITERKKTEAELAKRTREVSLLYEAGMKLGQTLDLEAIYSALYAILSSAVGCDGLVISAYDSDAKQIRFVYGQHQAAHLDVRAFPPIPLHDERAGILGTVMATGKSLNIPDYQAQGDLSGLFDPVSTAGAPPADAPLAPDGVVHSALVVPLKMEDQVIGVIQVFSYRPDAFTPGDLRLVEALARQVAAATVNALLFEQAQAEIAERERAEAAEREQRALTDALHDIAMALNSTLDLDEVLERILVSLEHVVPFDGAAIMLVDGDQARVAHCRGYYVEHGLDKEILGRAYKLNELGTISTMIANRQAVLFEDVQADPRWRSYPTVGWIRAYLGAPIQLEGRTIGILNLGSTTPGAFQPKDAQRLQAFTDQAAVAIQNARLYHELENYSSILEQAVGDATAELRQAIEHLEAILKYSPGAILLLDTQGTIETSNPAFNELFGYAQRDIYDQPLVRVVEESDVAVLQRALDRVITTLTTQRIEVVARRKDGTTFDANLALAPIAEEDGLLGLICSLWDISALKEIDRMKDAFISTAAHELRTPLTSIQGFSEILLTRALDESRRERYLDLINQQSIQLAKIIDDLLDVSRLETGRNLDLKLEGVDIAALVDDILPPFVETSFDHRFELVGLANLPPVYGDPFRLGQVVRNLVSNAVKYAPDGGTITIKAREIPGFVEIGVQDEGIGLTPEQQGHIFERFYRADMSNNAVGGTGLGLTICKLIVELHGGHIWVDSHYGVGSTFSFTVPLLENHTQQEE